MQAAFAARQAAEEFEVWPENWDTVALFMLCQRQWRVAPMGGVIGLDYSAIDVLLRRLGVETTPDTFAGLQVMEAAAVAELNRET